MGWLSGAVLGVLSALLVVCSASAQLPTSAAAETYTVSDTYWLRVTGDRVNVRSRPDTNSIVVAQVERGAVLEAEGEQFGWHRIRPPVGVYSLVSAAYVRRSGGGDTGVVAVASGTLRVRVGSTVQELDPLQAEVQTRLANGAAVQIVGEQDGWYQIVPPADVRVYITDEFVTRISAAEAQRLRSEAAEQRQLVAASQPVEAGAEASPEIATTQPAGPSLSGAWGQKLVAVEGRIAAEAEKKLAEQDWEELVGALRQIAVQREEPMVARLANAWIGKLERRTAEGEAVLQADEILRRIERRNARHEQEMARIEQLRRQAATRPAYDARGTLEHSYAVGPDQRRWYKLQDPLTRRVEVYLVFPDGGPVSPEQLLGRYVGVHGTRKFEPKLGADVLQVRSVDVLERKRATTRPAPRPAEQRPPRQRTE